LARPSRFRRVVAAIGASRKVSLMRVTAVLGAILGRAETPARHMELRRRRGSVRISLAAGPRGVGALAIDIRLIASLFAHDTLRSAPASLAVSGCNPRAEAGLRGAGYP